MYSTPRTAVWHRDDLRVRDNAALAAAVADGQPCPIYVFDPQFYRSGTVCDARLRFVHESLTDLAARYGDHGSDLALFHGDPERLLEDYDWSEQAEAYFERDPTRRPSLVGT